MIKMRKHSEYYNGMYLVNFKTQKCIDEAIRIFKEENLLLKNKLRWTVIKKNKHHRIEEILRGYFHDIPKSYYLAGYYSIYGGFAFHKKSTKPFTEVTELYHLTDNIDKVLEEGLISRKRSKDDKKYYENRIYFCLIPFSEAFKQCNHISRDPYFRNRTEIKITLKEPIKVYNDCEYDILIDVMVYSKINHIPKEFIEVIENKDMT